MYSRYNFDTPTGRTRLALIEQYLRERPHTVRELAGRLELTMQRVYPFVAHLGDQVREVGRAPSRCNTTVPVWGWRGVEYDIEEPTEEFTRGPAWDCEAGNLLPRRDPMVAAMFGAAPMTTN